MTNENSIFIQEAESNLERIRSERGELRTRDSMLAEEEGFYKQMKAMYGGHVDEENDTASSQSDYQLVKTAIEEVLRDAPLSFLGLQSEEIRNGVREKGIDVTDQYFDVIISKEANRDDSHITRIKKGTYAYKN